MPRSTKIVRNSIVIGVGRCLKPIGTAEGRHLTDNRPVSSMRAAIYARVSTFDQEPENQLAEVRRYVEARGWSAREYTDRGVSGAKDRRPALDELVKDARRRRFDVLVCWRLDRLGRNLKHLITLLDELQGVGVAFVSLAEGIDATTAAGKLQMHILGAIAEFERERIRERVMAGLQRARAQGTHLGRPRRRLPQAVIELAQNPNVGPAAASKQLGVSLATAYRWLKQARAAV